MTFLCTNGRERKIKNVSKYLIDWESDCKSGIQKNVKNQLKDYWFADVVFEEFPVAGTRLSLDFYNSTQKIAVEVDGNQHYRYNKFFHSNSRQNFLHQLKRDEKKEYFCDINQIKLIRVLESDVLDSEKYPKSLIKLLK
jgi:very-short-patch-repair endonuclease|tara:strand:+ start:789 stop:1205 length:417 start_codon:yes stop_codon:yes gene_type:complete